MKNHDRLYELLPIIHRRRDAEQGYPLRGLLRVIGEQVAVIEDEIEQLYDNWFIETCEDWVVPYLGDLIGYRPVHETSAASDSRLATGLNRALTPRREVANTIAARRRRGTLALLENLANDAAGWPARAVEFYQLLGWGQHLNHPRLHRARTVDLRRGDALERIGTPFDECAHTVAVRRRGRYNLPSVGTFVWRLRAQSITGAPAACLEKKDGLHFTFSILGNDTPLFAPAEPEIELTHIAGEANVPAPIRRRPFEDRPSGPNGHLLAHASTKFYGAGKSVAIWVQKSEGDELLLWPAESIVPADLNRWHYRPKAGKIAVDPVLGRLAFHRQHEVPKGRILVRYYYGFSTEMGGGEYARTLSQPPGSRIYRVGKQFQVDPPRGPADFNTINAAIAKWRDDQAAAGTDEEKKSLRAAVIEIIDSGAYSETPRIVLEPGESLQVRAASGARPVLRLLDREADAPDPLRIAGKKGSRVVLDGLLIAGRGVQVDGPDVDPRQPGAPADDLCDLTIRHCTLVPGWALDCYCEPRHSTEPSLTLVNTHARVKIEHSILGPVKIVADEVKSDPVALTLTDCIWDAMDTACFALSGAGDTFAHAALEIARCTVLGAVRTHEIVLAENSIFTGAVRVVRRRRGCVRFCYVPPGECTRTPRRYECQPDLVRQAVATRVQRGELTAAEAVVAVEREKLRVRPRFNSIRYGTPTYCQLAESCAMEIRAGADDESEMGAFHDLYQSQREANLRARLDEFTPAGAEADIILTT